MAAGRAARDLPLTLRTRPGILSRPDPATFFLKLSSQNQDDPRSPASGRPAVQAPYFRERDSSAAKRAARDLPLT